MYWFDLTLLTINCVAELALLSICLSRRVRAVWILGLYSFIATLGMMLVSEHAPVKYNALAAKVDVAGNVVMVAVFVGLLSQVCKRRWLYMPIAVAFLGLVIGQLICAMMRWHFGITSYVARMEMLTWTVGMGAMIATARLIPRPGKVPLLSHVWRDLTLGD